MLKRSLAVIFSAMLLAAPACSAEDAAQTPRTMTLTGTGMATGEPDIATLSAGVRTQGKTAREALSANSEAMSSVMSGMEALGIEKKDIQTSDFAVRPLYQRYDSRPGEGGVRPPPKIVGYEVSNLVSVTVRDLDRLGEALDTFVTLGANELHGVNFGFEDPNPLRDKAREEAVKDALDTANLLTNAAGIKLGRILTMSESGYAPPQPMGKAMRMEAASMDVPVASGELSVSASVTITFELE